ncbi:MAG: glycosyltransferase [Acetobacteraceae bacterium]|nr:glycosyltransferase [Acetobacteraceae bacterium]
MADPVDVFGPGWQHASGLAQHACSGRRVGPAELLDIYDSHLGVLNIRHEVNGLNGLNQRHFAPYVLGRPVVTDSQPDVTRCFEPGREMRMLVYRHVEELNEIYARLQRNPDLACRVGVAGRRRVLAQQTYAHRLDTIAALAGIKDQHMER